MTVVLIAVIAVVAIGVTIATARQSTAERNAVERHHQTLDLIGAAAGRAPAAAPPTAYQPRHRKSRAPRRPARDVWLVIVGAAAVVAAAGFVTVSLLSSHPSGPRVASPGTAPPAPTTTSVPPTTAPPTDPLVLVTSDANHAEYRMQGATVSVQLVSSAACWVEIRTGTGRGVVWFAGTLRPGHRQVVPTGPATGSVSVQLGNPSGIAVAVNGHDLAVPWPGGSRPFSLMLDATAA